MAKTNIVFNNTSYSVDESSFSAATAELQSHLSTVMNGTGATIDFGGTAYDIDSAKLSAATNEFITHLGTIAGSGHKVTVGGVEYGVDSAKVADAISELEAAFGGNGEERLEGDGAEYYTLAPTALSFRSTEPLNEFQEVKVNGQVVDPSNYTLEEGSTIVTLSIDYLKTLPVGDYNIEVVSANNAPSGGFTVAAPELNEYGFYYNQPYAADVPALGGNTVFFIREGGDMDVIVVDNGHTEVASYTASGNQMTVNALAGTFTGTFSSDGMEVYVNELHTTFKLGDESIVADEDYIYVYDGSLGGYVVNAIDKMKASYVAIKTGINGKPTVKLGNGAFAWNPILTTAPKIPDSVTIIGEEAFYSCPSLNRIEIPASVTNIGKDAFDSAYSVGGVFSSLASVTFAEGSQLVSIGEGAFSGCKMTSINIPDSVTNIGAVAFANCVNLRSVTIPDSVTALGERVFYGCTSLTSVAIGNDVTSINSNTFYLCTSLTSVAIGNGVTSISNYAFDNCTSLTSITFDGTINEWNAISFGENWNDDVPATHVQCSDGTVPLN